MLDKFTYRQKLKYLYIGVPAVLFIAYFFSFSSTIEAYQKVAGLKQLNNSDQSIRKALVEQTRVLNSVDSQLGMLNNQVSREYIIAVVSEYCEKNKLTVKEIIPEETYKSGELKVSTEVISVKGYYSVILKLLEYLEVKANVGKVTAVEFEKIKDPESRKIELIAKIYIQNIVL